MPAALDFRILGPLEVWRDGRLVALGGARQRGVLALLLLHANEAVSSDRLTDELWGDNPPSDASAALQAHVSRLRKLLAPEREGEEQPIETSPPGYRLRVASEALDLLRFEALVADGTRFLEGGDATAASECLRGALELWRGRPLADLEGESFAQEPIRALEERWLAAVETRIDADLEIGRHAELVAELAPLARRHPVRERFHGQLMLALYRAGRQAEALEAYAELRRTLVEERGLEPSPEVRALQEAILGQHPDLLLPRRGRRPGPARHRRRPWALIAAAAGAGVVTLTVLILAGREAGPSSGVSPSAGTVAMVALDDGRIVSRVAVGATPSALAAADGRVWVINADDQTLSRIDARSRAVETFGIGATPTDVAAGKGAVWVGSGGRQRRAQPAGLLATGVVRLDPETHTPRARFPLPRERPIVADSVADHLAVGAEGVWAVAPDGRVLRIDLATDRVVAAVPGVRARAIALGGGSVWALAENGRVTRVDARTNAIVGRGRVSATAVLSIAAGEGGAWVSAPADGTLWRVDPGAGDALVMRTIPVAEGTTDLAYGGGALWAVNPLRGTLARIADGSVRTIPIGGFPRAVAVGAGAAWVATAAAGSTARPPGETSAESATPPAASCESPFFDGPGPPRRLVVSDLPLQGGLRLSSQQMADAMAFVLRRHGFRAGRFRVAYQSCDDAVAATRLPDSAKCAANARAYGDARAVLAVIGPLNSDCALAAIPELGVAAEPLAMVSPLASSTALTRATPGAPPRLPGSLYPGGTRTFLRVFPTDGHQAAALALLAQRLGRAPVYVLDDGDDEYGRVVASQFERSAHAVGLPLAGRASWNAAARSQRALAVRVARAGPGAVFLGGRLDTGGPAVLRALRERLGPDVALLAPDGFTPLPFLIKAAGAAAATGTFVSLTGIADTDRLPAAGRRFAREFGGTLGGQTVEPSAIYAAQAMEVVLGAIARSDGTRESVRRALFATHLPDSLIGDVRFDASGDISHSPITILRVAPGTRTGPAAPDAAVDRVLRVPVDLVR